jgi:hypothetical protein
MALILGEGASDFISGNKMDFTNYSTEVDIHHIFPQKYCETQGYEKRKWNCIINKTPIHARTNRKIGGNAPSTYLKSIEAVVSSVNDLDKNVSSHGINVAAIREDDFDTFFFSRTKTILDLISKAMGKKINNLNSADIVEAFGKPLE